MRSAFLIWSLSVAAAALLAANAYVRRPDAPHSAPTVQAVEDNSHRPESAGTKASAGMKDSTERNDSTEGPPPGSAASSSPPPAFEWATIESSDYKQYVGNLRAIGFPEELVRSIVIADIDKLYAPREEPLKPKPVPPDAPPAQRQSGQQLAFFGPLYRNTPGCGSWSLFQRRRARSVFSTHLACLPRST